MSLFSTKMCVDAANHVSSGNATSASARSWTDDALDRLESLPCGYREFSPGAAEPTALAMLALVGAERIDAARRGDRWLASQQQKDGSIAALSALNWPGWPTPLAMLATIAFASSTQAPSDGQATAFDLQRAKRWLLAAAGKAISASPEFGHDGQLIGWSWAAGTHSWIEPTAWSVLALKSLGLSNHPRTREGVRLLVDRILSTGGCNYGNTVVLGQRLRPHVEPTGLTMISLADEHIDDPRIERSLRYLQSALSADTTPVSLSYGLLGLSAFGRRPAAAHTWLAAKFRDRREHDLSPLNLALLTLASQGSESVLIRAVADRRAQLWSS